MTETERAAWRLQEIERRCKGLQQKRQNHMIFLMWSACFGLCFCLGTLLHATDGMLHYSQVSGGYSSVLIHDDSEVYVVIGIGAFVVGVVFTLLCLKFRKH